MTNRIITKINDLHEKYFNNYNFNYLFLFLFFMMILYYIIYLDAYKEGFTTSSECLEAHQGNALAENAFKSPDDVGRQLTIKQLRDKKYYLIEIIMMLNGVTRLVVTLYKLVIYHLIQFIK